MAKYITVENSSFKIVESEKEPLNVALKEPENTWSNNEFIIAENGIRISWLDDYYRRFWRCIKVKYKGIELQKIKSVRKLQTAIDILNKYKSISEKELETLYQKVLKQEKSKLEKAVEKLKTEKQKITEEAETYIEILEKGREILSLIKGLEEE